jgi:predicted ATP-grasp superfamily ATP-dependent carboligase
MHPAKVYGTEKVQDIYVEDVAAAHVRGSVGIDALIKSEPVNPLPRRVSGI